MAATFNSGPIPGENFTSDTKNYPWRQPPEFSDLDDALDFLAKKITQFKVANGLLTMAEIGVPLWQIADMLLTQGVGEGKWTVDFTLLMAGPLTRMVELICMQFGIEYNLGIDDDEDNFTTGTYLQNVQNFKTPPGGFKLLDEQLPEIKDAASEGQGDASGEPEQNNELQQQGFMAMTGGDPSGGEGEAK
jgi:hypothetical protein